MLCRLAAVKKQEFYCLACELGLNMSAALNASHIEGYYINV
jgi:hypothetical protein